VIFADRPHELQYRPTTDGWSPCEIKRASDAADAGQLMRLADLCETIMADDRVDGVLDTRTHGLLGLPLTFEGGLPAMQSDLTEGDAWWQSHEEGELAKLLRWGLVMGIGLAQRVPLPRLPTERQRYRIETWSPRWLTQIHRGDSVEWLVQTSKGASTVVPGAGQWIVYTPYGRNRPWAEGKWRRLAFPWILKRYGLEDRANMSQSHGTPTKVGKTARGSTQPQRDRFLSQLQTLGKNGTLVLPEGWDLNLVESTSKAYEIFDSAIAWSDQALTIVLAGQVVTTQGSPGFSSGNVQERIVGDLIRFDAETLSTTLRMQSLVPLAWDWYDDGDAAPWPRWDTQRTPDKEAIARTLEILGRAVEQLGPSLSSAGVQVDTRAMLEALGVPLSAVEAEKQRASFQLAPTDVARVVRVREARSSQGLPPLGDERDDLFVSELEAAAEAAGGPGASALPPPAADITAEGPDADDMRREAAEALAAKMTELQVERCEHGRSNRCPLCGVERSRDVELAPDGTPSWALAWRAL